MERPALCEGPGGTSHEGVMKPECLSSAQLRMAERSHTAVQMAPSQLYTPHRAPGSRQLCTHHLYQSHGRGPLLVFCNGHIFCLPSIPFLSLIITLQVQVVMPSPPGQEKRPLLPPLPCECDEDDQLE